MHRLSLFGGFSLALGDEDIPVRSAKQRCILAYLAVHAPERCTRDQVAEQFWGWRERGRSRQSLRTALSALRTQSDAEGFLQASGDEIWLDLEKLQVDVVTFQRLYQNHDEGSLREAAELFKGQFLSGVSTGDNEIEEWIAGVRNTFQTRALDTLVSLAEKRASIGRFDQAIGYARRAVEIDELSEEAQRALISNLVSANRRADALRQGRAFMQRLEAELSTVPSAETLALIDSLQVTPSVQSGIGAIEFGASAPSGSAPAPPTHRVPGGLVERRPLTVLAYEIVGLETATSPTLETLAETVSLIGRAVQTVADEWCGMVTTNDYDGGVIQFGNSENTENQYDDAIEAALDLTKAISELRPPGLSDVGLDVAAAIDTATSMLRTEESGPASVIVSPSVLQARRINRFRKDGGIVITSRVRDRLAGSYELVPEGALSSDGEADAALTCWRVESRGRSKPRFATRTRRVLSLVGRNRELAVLDSRWRDVTISGGQVVVLRGDPGIGKSRLLHEFQTRLTAESAKTILLQCSPDGMNVALSPLVNLISRRAGSKAENLAFLRRVLRRLDLADVAEIGQLGIALGFEAGEDMLSAANQREANRRVQRSLEYLLDATTRSGPVCIQVEDIHWADASTLAQLQHLAEWVREKPVMLVLTSRVDSLKALYDEVNVTNVLLRKLDPNEALKLARGMWESMTDEAIKPEVADRIRGFGDGVPLFLEELVYWYRERERKNELELAVGADWIDESPPVAELLMSRLNALGSSKAVAQIAAVIGRNFDEVLLSAVCRDVMGIRDVERNLGALMDNEIIRQVWPQPAAEYEFRHILLREAAYGALREADRRFVHGKIYALLKRDADEDSQVSLIDLARHAEACGEVAAAAAALLQAGRDTAFRMALTEATQLLTRALDVSDGIDHYERRQELQLSIISVLGPLLTSQFGPRDARSIAMYTRGVGLARQLPPPERVKHYAIFWGWWYTGKDFREMRDRAIRVQEMLGTIEDSEIVLQTNHCIWAIDFNLGNHQAALHAIERGLAHYDPERVAETSVAPYGGHDAKVCGLGQKALLLWLTGQEKESDETLATMTGFVSWLNHVPSTAHALDTEAVSAFYRDDYKGLIEVSARMSALAKTHSLQVLDGLSRLFGGWAVAHTGKFRAGMKTFVSGLETMESLGSAVDMPLYLYMHATLLETNGDAGLALEIIGRAIAAAEESGHSYWLAELYRRRASLRAVAGEDPAMVREDIARSLDIAKKQKAKSLENRTRATAATLLPHDAL